MAALLEIAEPGQSQVKEACLAAAVGIDLGTTNSLVAVVGPDPATGVGKPRALPVDEGSTLLPSVVSYREDGPPIVGREARFLHLTLAGLGDLEKGGHQSSGARPMASSR